VASAFLANVYLPLRLRSLGRALATCEAAEADQPLLTDLIEEAADIGIQYPVHLCGADSDDER